MSHVIMRFTNITFSNVVSRQCNRETIIHKKKFNDFTSTAICIEIIIRKVDKSFTEQRSPE